MEADFSIRNEVDSVLPPHEDKTEFYNDEPAYDEEIIRGISSAPPFPQYPYPPYPSYPTPQSNADLHYLLRTQHKLIKQQQFLNYNITKQLVNNLKYAKWTIVGLAAALVYLIVINNKKLPVIFEDYRRESRENEIARRQLRRNHIQSLLNEFE